MTGHREPDSRADLSKWSPSEYLFGKLHMWMRCFQTVGRPNQCSSPDVFMLIPVSGAAILGFPLKLVIRKFASYCFFRTIFLVKWGEFIVVFIDKTTNGHCTVRTIAKRKPTNTLTMSILFFGRLPHAREVILTKSWHEFGNCTPNPRKRMGMVAQTCKNSVQWTYRKTPFRIYFVCEEPNSVQKGVPSSRAKLLTIDLVEHGKWKDRTVEFCDHHQDPVLTT